MPLLDSERMKSRFTGGAWGKGCTKHVDSGFYPYPYPEPLHLTSAKPTTVLDPGHKPAPPTHLFVWHIPQARSMGCACDAAYTRPGPAGRVGRGKGVQGGHTQLRQGQIQTRSLPMVVPFCLWSLFCTRALRGPPPLLASDEHRTRNLHYIKLLL